MAATTEAGARYMAAEDYLGPMQRTEPAETPLFSLLKNETQLRATTFDWPVDAWNAPKGAVGRSDNDPVVAADLTNNAANRRKMGNTGQAFVRPFGTGWIQQAVPTTPGVSDEAAKAAADELVILKQEICCALGSADQFAQDDQGAADQGGTMAGLGALTSRSNTYSGTTCTAGKVPVAFIPPADACVGDTNGAGVVTEGDSLGTTLNMVMLRAATTALRGVVKRNRDYTLLCGVNLRSAITGLSDPAQTQVVGVPTQVRTFVQQVTDTELGASIDVIRTDHGRLLVVESDWIGLTAADSAGAYTATQTDRVFTVKPNYGYILSRDVLAKRWGVMPEKFKLDSGGSGDWAGYRAYCGLVVHHPQLHGHLFFKA
jgi:hypothetical protein